MTNKFDWLKMHKDEEYIEREAYTCVETAICNHYDVEEMSTLTQEQWDDIMEWREKHVSEYSPMYGGIADVYNVWEMEQEDANND